MANRRNILQHVLFIVWTLCYVTNSGAQESSGDSTYMRSAHDLMSAHDLVSTRDLSSTQDLPTQYLTSTQDLSSTENVSTLIAKLTSTQVTAVTDQTTTSINCNTTVTKKLESTSSAKTTSQQTTKVTVKPTKPPLKEKNVDVNKEKTELLTRLNGYKIATISLATVLGIIALIILIYFSAKSKTGRGEITCPPSTPPEDVENVPEPEEPQGVRLSSYFPYVNNGRAKVELNEDDDDEALKVSTFLTKKKSFDAAGSQEKILHTSEL